MYLENVDTLNKWCKAYYTDDNSIASDDEYDRLYRDVLAYETEHPDDRSPDTPTIRVGAGISEGFIKAEHKNRMWSQEDIFNLSELTTWYNRICKSVESDNPTFTCEPKYDGLSLKLIYDKGQLIQAITRGDGEIGEDVTDNAMMINSIPTTISLTSLTEICGEVVIKKSDFEILNKQREIEELPMFRNSRNAASGSLRQLDSSVTAKRRLTFYPWSLESADADIPNEQHIRMELLHNIGFKKAPIAVVVSSLDGLSNAHHSMSNLRATMDEPLDGMVIKLDDTKLHTDLGYTNKYPRWSCAYKFVAVEKTTRVTGIVWQVGRTGVIVPVATLVPVLIDGSLVSRVTLHNKRELTKLGLMIGDHITIIKSGDIIPKLTKVLKDRRDDGDQYEYTISPNICPTCGTPVFDDGVNILCQNTRCPDRMVNAITHATGISGLNIKDLGPSVVGRLVSSNKIETVLDLYNLTYSDLEGLEGFKERSISKLLDSINASKGCELHRLITGLGIHTVGRTMSRLLAKKYGLGFVDVESKSLVDIDGLGDVGVRSILQYLATNREYVMKLIDTVNPTVNTIEVNKLLDKVIVLTGSMSRGRSEYVRIFDSIGATMGSSVTKKTDYLVCSSESGVKYDKAVELGIKILTENELIELLP